MFYTPASIAIHNHSDMVWPLFAIDLCQRGRQGYGLEASVGSAGICLSHSLSILAGGEQVRQTAAKLPLRATITFNL